MSFFVEVYLQSQANKPAVIKWWTHSPSPLEKCTRTAPVLLEDDHAVRTGTATFVLAVVVRFGSKSLASGGTLRTRSKSFKSELKQAGPEENMLVAVSRAARCCLTGTKNTSDHGIDLCLSLVEDLES